MPNPSTPLLIRVGVCGLGLVLFAGQVDLSALSSSGPGVGTRMAAGLVGLIAPAFFLWAVWSVANVLADLDRGNAFDEAMIRGLQAMGASLMLGAVAVVIVQPGLIYLIGNGFTQMRGVEFALDVNALAIALVGLALVLLARRAAVMKAHLDGFV